jgi:hypothetical protein
VLLEISLTNGLNAQPQFAYKLMLYFSTYPQGLILYAWAFSVVLLSIFPLDKLYPLETFAGGQMLIVVHQKSFYHW